MGERKILIVDDDPQIRMLLKDRLVAYHYEVAQADNGVRGLEMITKENPDLVLLDLQMPEMDGMEVLHRLRKNFPDLPVVILTAHGTIGQAVEAMKQGAYDFLPKPCKPDHILVVLKKALERRELQEQNQYLREELDSQYQMVVGENSEMKRVMGTAQQVAQSRTTVLIEGESGTGKQLMARAIHSMSDRKNRAFVQVNCTTLSEQLLESDLFGHEKGAFTGATRQKKGRYELAENGTLFLDEIGDLSASIQAKLLHILEYGEFQRVGGVNTLKADVRIIAATNKDLKNEVDEGCFREDLFYRLNVITIKIPPLRERSEDILLFAEYFLQKYNCIMKKNIERITPKAIEMLRSHHWPGNIRELENTIERAVVLATSEELDIDLFSALVGKPSEEEIDIGTTLEEALLKFKKQFIIKNLHFTHNSQTQAAKLLDIQRTYLNRLIKELNINL